MLTILIIITNFNIYDQYKRQIERWLPNYSCKQLYIYSLMHTTTNAKAKRKQWVLANVSLICTVIYNGCLCWAATSVCSRGCWRNTYISGKIYIYYIQFIFIVTSIYAYLLLYCIRTLSTRTHTIRMIPPFLRNSMQWNRWIGTISIRTMLVWWGHVVETHSCRCWKYSEQSRSKIWINTSRRLESVLIERKIFFFQISRKTLFISIITIFI